MTAARTRKQRESYSEASGKVLLDQIVACLHASNEFGKRSFGLDTCFLVLVLGFRQLVFFLLQRTLQLLQQAR